MPEEARYRVSSRDFIVIGIVLALGIVAAGWILGLQIKQTKLGEHYVTVKGLEERVVKSDLAIWSISFRASGDDFKTVLTQGESQKQSVLNFLKKEQVGDNEITIDPPSVLDREAQEYGGAQGRQSRYILTQNVVVTSKDVDQIAAANQRIGDLLKQGVILAAQGGSGSRVSYKYNDLNSIKPDMITAATKNARAAAERFAQDSGAKVGSIRQASQGVFSISAADEAGSPGGGMYNSADSSIMKKVRVVSTIEYYLLQ